MIRENQRKRIDVYISLAILPQNLTNMTKITYLQALIDSSMPAELKKCNETPKNLHGL